MSKTEMVKRSASEQAVPLQARARSTAEAQMVLIARLDRLAEDQVRLTEEQRTAARELSAGMTRTAQRATETVEAVCEQMETVLTRATSTLQRTEERVLAAEKAVKTVTARAVGASQELEAQASRLRWTIIIIAAASGLLTGMVLLIALLIWQPELIRQLWTIAQAIR